MLPNTAATEELLAQAKKGDSHAADQLLAGHRERLRRMIELRLDPAIAARVDASDVVQETLLEASRRLDAYLRDPVMPFHLWLRHIAKDRLIDAHRRHRQAKRRGVDREQPAVPAGLRDHSSIEMAGQFVDQELTPASAAMKEELKRRLHAAIGELEEDDREIILMRHFEQMSNQEVAALHGVTEAAASMRHLRALRRLKELLDPA
jgi:RNA polymerase sigma-70 factor, ECF subfamily